jgi:adenylate kinase family enzyme
MVSLVMRIAVVGTSGSGKTTQARQLAQVLAIPHIDIDAINWQAGWRDLNTHDPDEFRRRVSAALAGDGWVTDGNYGRVAGPIILGRATHLVWLDYSRPVVMRRVIWRSFWRAAQGAELWPGTGNRETFRQWFADKDHPIRWAWRTHAMRRKQYEALTAQPDHAHLDVLRLRHPRDADGVVRDLSRQIASGATLTA